MYQNILFDLDGTLTNPGEGITNSVAYALKKWKIEVKDKRELYPFIGPPLMDSFQTYYQFSEEDSRQAVTYYREYFSEKGIYENEVYDGVREILEELKGKKKSLILATSKPEVGDREYDIAGAKQAGMDSLGVLFGYGSYEELKRAGATYLAKTVSDILCFL